MTNEAREERNRYQREWRAKHKERVKEIDRRYWENKARRAKDDAISKNT